MRNHFVCLSVVLCALVCLPNVSVASELVEFIEEAPAAVHEDGLGYCGPCDDYCEPCFDACTTGRFIGGAGFYFVQPVWETNPAFGFFQFSAPTITGDTREFQWDFEFAPRVDIGYLGCCGWGVQARYWRFDGDATESLIVPELSLVSPANPLNAAGPFGPSIEGAAVTVSHDLETDVFDLEAVREWQGCGWRLLLSAGARHARLAQEYRFQTDFATGGEVFGIVRSGHVFEGTGPTIALEGHYAVVGGFALYAGMRSSLLYGSNDERATVTGIASGFDPIVFQDMTKSEYSLLPILEAELGAEYSVELGCGRFFVQAGVVGQTWFGAGNAANVESISSGIPGPFGSTSGFADNSANMSFFGITLRAGFDY